MATIIIPPVEPKLGILSLTCVGGDLKRDTGNIALSMNPFCTFTIEKAPVKEDEKEDGKEE